jgi:C1A family cysteine protease
LLPGQLSALLDELRSGIPVATGLRWPNNFSTQTIKGIPVMKTPGPKGVTDGHSIAFVGFKTDSSFPGGGYLIFRNSWGKMFQEDGYGYMPFKYAKEYANDVVKYVQPLAPPPHGPPPKY